MANDRVEIEIVLDDGSVQKGFAKVEKSGKKTGAGIAKSFAKIGGVAIAAGAALGAVFTAKAVALAQQQEDAVNKLNTSLRLTGKFSKEASTDIQNFASQLQRTTTVGDEATLETAGLIQSLGNLSTEGLKTATAAAVDLSAALGIDLNAAALLVGKAAAGEVSSFSRYGLVIKKGADNASTFATALDAINSKFGGAAAAKVETFSGVTDQLGNNFGDVLEKFGDLIIKSPTVISALKLVSGFFAKLGDSIAEFTEGKDFFGPIVNGAAAAGKAILAVFAAPIELAVNVVSLAFKSVVNGINAAIASIVSAASFLANKLNPNSKLAQNLKTLASSTGTTFQQSSASVNQALATIGDTPFTDGVGTQIDAIQERVVNLSAEIQASANSLTSSVSTGTQGAIVAQKTLFEEFSSGFSDVIATSAEGSAQLAKITQTGLANIRKLGAGFAKGFGMAFAEVGKALATGKDAFAAFGQAILGVLGDIAINAGLEFFLIGLASFNPGQVALGAALITLGGALKALSGGKGGVGTATAAGGAGGADSPEPEGVDFGDEEAERSTAVTVNVEGAVLDPVGTGQAIVGILQETFDTTGSQVVTNVA